MLPWKITPWQRIRAKVRCSLQKIFSKVDHAIKQCFHGYRKHGKQHEWHPPLCSWSIVTHFHLLFLSFNSNYFLFYKIACSAVPWHAGQVWRDFQGLADRPGWAAAQGHWHAAATIFSTRVRKCKSKNILDFLRFCFLLIICVLECAIPRCLVRTVQQE